MVSEAISSRSSFELDLKQRFFISQTPSSRDHDDLDLQTMRDLIGGSDGAYYYRIVLSPGAPHNTDVNLKDWTRDLILELEGKHSDFPYVAIEHRDQTDHAHVHLVMYGAPPKIKQSRA